jgi:hypothetical protein
LLTSEAMPYAEAASRWKRDEMDSVITRRKLLSTAALGCAGLGLGVAGAPPARAFTLEAPSQPLAAQYLAARAACSRGGTDSLHAQIIADVQAQLSGEHVPADQQQRILAGMTCPLCGCPLG